MLPTKQTILIAEDDPVQRMMLEALLRKKLGYDVLVAGHGKEAVELVEATTFDGIHAALLDLSMPIMDGFKALAKIKKIRPNLPVLMLTAADDTATAVKAIKEGAYDFIVKPPEADHLSIILSNAIHHAALAQELLRIKRDKAGALLFTDLVGHEDGLKEAIKIGRKAALSDVPVLITGETGVGKELFARAVHGESRRSGAPFIAINCGAIPEKLIESTLFGHEKGSFTGAIGAAIGKFREAEGGTLFLDEVGELPLEAQVKLLRALQQKEVEPVGAARPVKVNVRVISATNRDLKEEVEGGQFRKDLYFRLNVLPIEVPALRQRKEDIISLAEHFLKRITILEKLAEKSFADDAKEALRHHAWTGNVRELENAVHRAVVLSDEEIISAATLNETGALGELHFIPQNSSSSVADPFYRKASGSLKTMAEIEQEAMKQALVHFDNNITKAAEALGIAKSTFYRKRQQNSGDAP